MMKYYIAIKMMCFQSIINNMGNYHYYKVLHQFCNNQHICTEKILKD